MQLNLTLMRNVWLNLILRTFSGNYEKTLQLNLIVIVKIMLGFNCGRISFHEHVSAYQIFLFKL